jgi:hypothetical protein
MKCHRRFAATKGIIALSVLFFFAGICSCSQQKESGSKSKTNSPPVITSVNISPEKPNKETELNLTIQSNDPDGDPINYSYQWIKNDEEIFGENKNALGSGNLKKGDLIRVKVTPSDGRIGGKPFLSVPVKILNSPPVIREVWVEPKRPYVTDNLKAGVKAFDADGDLIYYSFQWEKNGAVLPEERSEVLDRGKFKKRDSIAVIGTPDDREILGTPKKSEPVVILNSPPVIISSPPTSMEERTYLYHVKVNDPDNDPILFTLKSGPKGMEIDKKTGLIRWEIREEDKGTYPIEIEASDDDGGKSIQRYTLRIEVK